MIKTNFLILISVTFIINTAFGAVSFYDKPHYELTRDDKYLIEKLNKVIASGKISEFSNFLDKHPQLIHSARLLEDMINSSNVQITQLLLARGANPNIKTRAKVTLFRSLLEHLVLIQHSVFAKEERKKVKDIGKLLIEYGVDLDSPEGKEAIKFAEDNKIFPELPEIIKEVQSKRAIAAGKFLLKKNILPAEIVGIIQQYAGDDKPLTRRPHLTPIILPAESEEAITRIVNKGASTSHPAIIQSMLDQGVNFSIQPLIEFALAKGANANAINPVVNAIPLESVFSFIYYFLNNPRVPNRQALLEKERLIAKLLIKLTDFETAGGQDAIQFAKENSSAPELLQMIRDEFQRRNKMDLSEDL